MIPIDIANFARLKYKTKFELNLSVRQELNHFDVMEVQINNVGINRAFLTLNDKNLAKILQKN